MNDVCSIHKIQLECMAGRSAHASNWYCPECDKTADQKKYRGETEVLFQGSIDDLDKFITENSLHKVNKMIVKFDVIKNAISQMRSGDQKKFVCTHRSATLNNAQGDFPILNCDHCGKKVSLAGKDKEGYIFV